VVAQSVDTSPYGGKPLNLRDSAAIFPMSAGPMSQPCLQAENLHLWRGDHHVLRGVGLTLSAGECLQVAGSNGAGKTSLLRTLTGLMYPEEGRVLWRGADIRRDLAGFHADLAYIGHEPPLKSDLTPRENLRYWVGVRRELSGTLVDQALERVGATNYRQRAVRTLSAGQKRRVALAGLLLMAAPLWLLDEPTTHLDAEGQRLLGVLIDEQTAGGGLVVAATHQALPVVRTLARRVELNAPDLSGAPP